MSYGDKALWFYDITASVAHDSTLERQPFKSSFSINWASSSAGDIAFMIMIVIR